MTNSMESHFQKLWGSMTGQFSLALVVTHISPTKERATEIYKSLLVETKKRVIEMQKETVDGMQGVKGMEEFTDLINTNFAKEWSAYLHGTIEPMITKFIDQYDELKTLTQ